jgi:hypothetical protein
MFRVLDRLAQVWIGAPVALKIIGVLAMLLVLLLATAAPGMANQSDPRPFRW